MCQALKCYTSFPLTTIRQIVLSSFKKMYTRRLKEIDQFLSATQLSGWARAWPASAPRPVTSSCCPSSKRGKCFINVSQAQD